MSELSPRAKAAIGEARQIVVALIAKSRKAGLKDREIRLMVEGEIAHMDKLHEIGHPPSSHETEPCEYEAAVAGLRKALDELLPPTTMTAEQIDALTDLVEENKRLAAEKGA